MHLFSKEPERSVAREAADLIDDLVMRLRDEDLMGRALYTRYLRVRLELLTADLFSEGPRRGGG
jgi:hypothetical protein